MGAFCSVVILLTFHLTGAIGCVVLGCATVAFLPRRGEREKVRSAVHTTKASAAADQGRLPRWACCVYFCATSAFLALAFAGVFSTDQTSCSPCICIDSKLIDCKFYEDAQTLVWTEPSWNREFSPRRLNLENKDIKAIEPGALEGMATLQRSMIPKNKISSIEPYTFAGLVRLERLDLERNKIEIVKSNAFHGLHRLTRLILKFNEIQTLEADAFRGLHNLERLQLKKNNIKPHREWNIRWAGPS